MLFFNLVIHAGMCFCFKYAGKSYNIVVAHIPPASTYTSASYILTEDCRFSQTLGQEMVTPQFDTVEEITRRNPAPVGRRLILLQSHYSQ